MINYQPGWLLIFSIFCWYFQFLLMFIVIFLFCLLYNKFELLLILIFPWYIPRKSHSITIQFKSIKSLIPNHIRTIAWNIMNSSIKHMNSYSQSLNHHLDFMRYSPIGIRIGLTDHEITILKLLLPKGEDILWKPLWSPWWTTHCHG